MDILDSHDRESNSTFFDLFEHDLEDPEAKKNKRKSQEIEIETKEESKEKSKKSKKGKKTLLEKYREMYDELIKINVDETNIYYYRELISDIHMIYMSTEYCDRNTIKKIHDALLKKAQKYY